MLSTGELFDLERVPAWLRELLAVEFPWQALARLDAFGAGLAGGAGAGSAYAGYPYAGHPWAGHAGAGSVGAGTVHPSAVVEGPLVMEEGAEVGPCAYLTGPVYLARGAKVGHGAYLRGPVILGPNAYVMHASEVKRSILLGGAKAPHFNYVGDSVVGHGVNLGAGVKLANFKTMGTEISVAGVATGLRKFGAALGDGVSIGCNAVLSPGTVVGPRSIIYNLASVRGLVPADTIVKHAPQLQQVPLRP